MTRFGETAPPIRSIRVTPPLMRTERTSWMAARATITLRGKGATIRSMGESTTTSSGGTVVTQTLPPYFMGMIFSMAVKVTTP
ncbi:hypothetical protein D3C87_951600 [compost metagenome]